MGKINILDKKVYSRIAAGEVVERPFSVVKELVENSIDAKAKNIEISIYNGGKDLIQIIDDGVGIDKDDLPKAVMPHATSKILNIEDLDSILTLGFRGEALASIASVSVLTIISKTEQEKTGYQIIAKDDTISDVTPAPCDTGTFISVENLFYNTPARAKFLKSSNLEESDITSMVKRLVFANSNIAFKYIVDGKTVLQTDGNGLESAFVEVYGYKAIKSCLYIDVVKHGIRFTGYIGKEDFTKPNRTYQNVFLNSRYVVNNTIQSAIYNAYAPNLMSRQYPFYVLIIDIPPQFIDVNVHPNKTDVRFVDNQSIYGLFYSTVKDALQSASTVGDITASNNFPTEKPNYEQREKADYGFSYKEDKPVSEFSDYADNYINTSAIYKKDENKEEDLNKLFAENKKYAEELENLKKPQIKQEEIQYVYDFQIIGQALSTYIILERNDELFLVDQHAAHERYLYNEYEREFNSGKVASQSTLVPYIFTVNEKEYEIIDAVRVPLIKMGFDICDYDYNEIAVYGLPVAIWDIDLKAFFDDLLSDSELKRTDMPEIIHEKLAKKACRAAIKSGDKLSDEEIRCLLDDLKYDLNLRCPHGRPIALKITRTEIDKWFKRIV